MRDFRAALRDLRVTVAGFCRLTGMSTQAVVRWDKAYGHPAPDWAWFVVETWQKFPEALAWARDRLE